MRIRKLSVIAGLSLQVYFILTYLYAYMFSSTSAEYLITFSRLWPSFTNPYAVHFFQLVIALILIAILVYPLARRDSTRLKVFLAFEALLALFLIPGLL